MEMPKENKEIEVTYTVTNSNIGTMELTGVGGYDEEAGRFFVVGIVSKCYLVKDKVLNWKYI